MLDDENAEAEFLAQPEQNFPELGNLGVVQARNRLIQQQEADIHQQRPAEIDQLAVAVGQIADRRSSALSEMPSRASTLVDPLAPRRALAAATLGSRSNSLTRP